MKRILICEDEKDTQQSLKSILEKKNYEIFAADNGKDAVDITKSSKPDLILLDIRMPKIDGLEVAQQIRDFNKETKIIFISAFAGPEIKKEALRYQISDYIVKPVSVETIISAIESALK